MKWPFISRSSHEAIVALLRVQVDELKAERTVLYDRLARLGLGGELFKVPDYVQEPEPEEQPETMDERIEKILAMRRRPTLMQRAIRNLAMEEMKKRGMGPDVSWVPAAQDVTAMLDQAEAEGRKQA